MAHVRSHEFQDFGGDLPRHELKCASVSRRPVSVWWLLLGLPVLAYIHAAFHPLLAQPILLRSEESHFVIGVAGIERPEHVNHLHGFELSLTAADGRPASGASIVLTGQHRYALNPLPTSPRVRPGPVDGTYRVEGLRFHMAGEWRLVFAIDFEQIRDRVTLDVVVK